MMRGCTLTAVQRQRCRQALAAITAAGDSGASSSEEAPGALQGGGGADAAAAAAAGSGLAQLSVRGRQLLVRMMWLKSAAGVVRGGGGDAGFLEGRLLRLLQQNAAPAGLELLLCLLRMSSSSSNNRFRHNSMPGSRSSSSRHGVWPPVQRPPQQQQRQQTVMVPRRMCPCLVEASAQVAQVCGGRHPPLRGCWSRIYSCMGPCRKPVAAAPGLCRCRARVAPARRGWARGRLEAWGGCTGSTCRCCQPCGARH